MKGSRAAAPKGTKSCRTQGDFRSSCLKKLLRCYRGLTEGFQEYKLRFKMADVRPENNNWRLKRADLRPERPGLTPERLELKPKRPDLRPEVLDLRLQSQPARPQSYP